MNEFIFMCCSLAHTLSASLGYVAVFSREGMFAFFASIIVKVLQMKNPSQDQRYSKPTERH